ncbi:MAG: Holliday junction branch migration protein RuvA [Bacteroidia bacterium]
MLSRGGGCATERERDDRYLNGKLGTRSSMVIIECGGVGYQAKISLNTYSKLGNDGAVKPTSMLKEDAHELYGFHDQKEKNLFIQLIGIQGVGGNTAMTILSSIEPKELYQVIEGENLNRLKQVKGIGAKTASRIILELKGKLVLDGTASAASPVNKLRDDAIAALVGLGMPKAAMEAKVDAILKAAGGDVPIDKIIREALRG